jgi:hypothetical protein
MAGSYAGSAQQLTQEQEAMWLADVRNQLEGESLLEDLVIIDNFWVHRAIDPDRLAECAAALVRQNEDYRSAVIVESGALVRRVVPPYEPSLCRIAVEAEPSKPRLEAAIEDLHKQLTAQIDMSGGRLLTVGLLALQHGVTSIFLAVHHMVCDEQSIQNLESDLLALYGNEQSAPDPPYNTLQPRIEGSISSSDIEWWHTKSHHIRQMAIGSEGDKSANYGHTTLTNFKLDASLSQAIKAIASATRATVFMVGLAIFQLFLAKWLHTKQPVILSMRSTRRLADKQKPGLRVEPIIFAWDLTPDLTFRDVIRISRNEVLTSLRSKHTFTSLSNEVPAIADIMTDDRHAMIMFQYIGQRPEISMTTTPVIHDTVHSGLRVVPVDIAWWLLDTPDGLWIRGLSRDQVIAPNAMRQAITNFDQFARALVAQGLDAAV